MKSLFTSFYQSLGVVVLCLGVFACSEDLENPMNLDTELSSAEVKTILNANELTGITDSFLLGSFGTAPSDKMSECHQTQTSGTTTILTFNDCVVGDSEPINGILTASYSVAGESTRINVTYTDFTIGNTAIKGSKTFTFSNNPDSIQFEVESAMQVIMEDGQVINEEGTRLIGFIFDSLEHQTITLDGQWNVMSNGTTYIVEITDQLATVLPCEYAGEGTIKLSKNGLLVTIDFGDGSCDDLASLTYPDGTTEEISLND